MEDKERVEEWEGIYVIRTNKMYTFFIDDLIQL